VSRQRPVEDRQRVVTYLPGDVVGVLDRLAEKHGTSRSEIVARIVERATAPASPSEPPEAPKPRASRPSPPTTPPKEIPPEPPPAPKYEFKSDLMRRTHGQS
jgi:hypothetical protein